MLLWLLQIPDHPRLQNTHLGRQLRVALERFEERGHTGAGPGNVFQVCDLRYTVSGRPVPTQPQSQGLLLALRLSHCLLLPAWRSSRMWPSLRFKRTGITALHKGLSQSCPQLSPSPAHLYLPVSPLATERYPHTLPPLGQRIFPLHALFCPHWGCIKVTTSQEMQGRGKMAWTRTSLSKNTACGSKELLGIGMEVRRPSMSLGPSRWGGAGPKAFGLLGVGLGVGPERTCSG